MADIKLSLHLFQYFIVPQCMKCFRLFLFILAIVLLYCSDSFSQLKFDSVVFHLHHVDSTTCSPYSGQVGICCEFLTKDLTFKPLSFAKFGDSTFCTGTNKSDSSAILGIRLDSNGRITLCSYRENLWCEGEFSEGTGTLDIHNIFSTNIDSKYILINGSSKPFFTSFNDDKCTYNFSAFEYCTHYGLDFSDTANSVIFYGVQQSGVDAEKELTFTIQPNPCSYTIEMNNLPSHRIEIFDLLGRNVLAKTVSENGALLDVSNLPEGNYLVRCGRSIQKMIINR